MKRILTIFLGIVLSAVAALAQTDTELTGATCETAIQVDTAYHCSLTPGQYWFTASTPALPLTINYYPEDTTAQPPVFYLDLTCTPGVYDDPNVAHMVSMAQDYNLSFPMEDVLDKQYDEEGNMYYTVLFDRNYRDMLYDQGVTYPLPAYVRLTHFTNATIDIKSTSINSLCRDYVYTLGMNTALRYAPEDSLNVYVWPIGEWIDSVYRITWTGEGKMELFTGKDCKVERNQRVYSNYLLPQDSIYMAPLKSKEWINDIYSTDLYVRLYAETEGTLRIATYNRQSKVNSVIFVVNNDTIHAAIDRQALTITAVLPYGAKTSDAVKWLAANKETAIKYEAYNGEIVDVRVGRKSTVNLGNLQYILNITVAQAEGSTDASLQSISIDGRLFEDFNSSTLHYADVEAATELPQITEVIPAHEQATYTIEQITALPGTAKVVVTAQAGNTREYTIGFILGRSHDATLSTITVDGKPLQGFSPDEYSYRMEVKWLPVVDAVATDPLSRVTVYQAKTIPGYAQIHVQAEAGNIESYTINFNPDNSVAECAAKMDTVAFDTPVPLGGGEPVYRIPVRNWTGQYLALNYDGPADLAVYALPICTFTPDELPELVIDTFLLQQGKGETLRTCYWRPDDLARLAKNALGGNIYLYIPDAVSGNLTITHFEETCATGSILLDLPSDNIMMAEMHSLVYKLYVPDYTAADTVRFIWTGTSPLTLYLARHCEFKLTADNRHILKPSPYSLAAGKDTLDILKAQWEDWAYEVDNFYYARVVNTATGTLSIIPLNAPDNPGTAIAAVTDATLHIQALPQQQLLVRSNRSQTVSLYTAAGLCLRTWQMYAQEQQTLRLPAGLYIVKGENQVQKVLINN